MLSKEQMNELLAIIVVGAMFLAWPVSAYIVSAKIRKAPARVTVRYIFIACFLTLLLGIILADAAAMKVKEWPWLEYAFPVCWVLAGMIFCVFYKIKQE